MSVISFAFVVCIDLVITYRKSTFRKCYPTFHQVVRGPFSSISSPFLILSSPKMMCDSLRSKLQTTKIFTQTYSFEDTDYANDFKYSHTSPQPLSTRIVVFNYHCYYCCYYCCYDEYRSHRYSVQHRKSCCHGWAPTGVPTYINERHDAFFLVLDRLKETLSNRFI